MQWPFSFGPWQGGGRLIYTHNCAHCSGVYLCVADYGDFTLDGTETTLSVQGNGFPFNDISIYIYNPFRIIRIKGRYFYFTKPHSNLLVVKLGFVQSNLIDLQ